MNRLLTPWRAAAAGLVVGCLLAGALAAGSSGGPTDRPGAGDAEGARESAAAARAFLDAWERSRTATYEVVSAYERRIDGEVALEGRTRTAQRPPDRLVVGPESVSGRLDGRRLACAEDDQGTLRCERGERLGPYRAAVDRELRLLEGYVLGPGRLYNAGDLGGGCYRLRLVRRLPAPPYGELARFCFDDATGAVVTSEVRRGRAVDHTVALTVSGEVTDDDLVPPGGDGQG